MQKNSTLFDIFLVSLKKFSRLSFYFFFFRRKNHHILSALFFHHFRERERERERTKRHTISSSSIESIRNRIIAIIILSAVVLL